MPPARDPETALLRRRLAAQQLASPALRSPLELVRHMGAVQAQDYAGGLWAVGVRLAGATEADVERAIAAAEIVRTWPMRRTLHLVPAEDARWMVRLLAARLLAGAAYRYRALGLSEDDLARAGRILARAMRGRPPLTRAAAYEALRRGGVAPEGQRGMHVLAHHAQAGLICCGPREGRQPTFVLLEEWVARSVEPSRDEALATLARRYFGGHGPATLHDFAWWSGLRVTDARCAIEAAGSELVEERRDGASAWVAADAAAGAKRGRTPAAALLPPWDEFLVAYRDRTAPTRELPAELANPLQFLGKPLVLVDGTVRGAWRRRARPSGVRLTLERWVELTARERGAIERAVARYRDYLARRMEVGGSGTT
jgi:hypothetical protein